MLQMIELQDRLSKVIKQYGSGSLMETRRLISSMRPPEIANLLESTPHKVRWVLWGLLHEDEENQVLQHLHEDVLSEFLESMNPERLASAAEELETDDFADLLQQLPETISKKVLLSLNEQDRDRIESVLSYPEDSAGGLMNTDTITVRPRHAIEIVLRYLRLQNTMPEATDALIVVNSRDEYVGMLPLSKLLTSDPSMTVREVMDTKAEAIPARTSDTDVARMFSDQDLISAPVVDKKGRLLGRITIDDVVDVIIEDADEAAFARAGLDSDEDTFAPIIKSARRRAFWLGINLFTAFLAASVINIFEETITKVVALAVLMPVVASMGGIAGTQTLTLVIRGMALGQVGRANIFYLLNREVLVALLNGIVLAIAVATVAALVFQDLLLGSVIAMAMVINLIVAGISGSLLPSLLSKLKIDPAIAGGVVLTTITDVTGFFSFLGLATWAYA